MNYQEKLQFLLKKFPEHLRSIDPQATPQWGKMNPQQMVEHMNDSVQQALVKVQPPVVTPADRLEKMREFLMSEKEFRPNTNNPIMPEKPVPCRLPAIEDAISQVESSLSEFVRYYGENPSATAVNPLFGEMNYEQWIQLLHKHSIHHLKQFSVAV